jgi:hypothetical protein
MSFVSALPHLAAAEKNARELPLPEWAYGGLALCGFMALLAVLWSFRNTAAKTGQREHGAHH